MSNRMIFFLVLCSLGLLLAQCKKTTKATYVSSALADSLRSTCTQPFVGAGDSSSIYLPTAFSPNGDGVNDVYKIIGGGTTFRSFMMTVYDTTGKIVFQTTNPMENWTGKDTTTGKLSTQYKFYVEVKYTTTGSKSVSGGTYVYLLAGSPSGCVNDTPADTAKYEFSDQFDLATGFNKAYPSFEHFCN